MGLKYLNSLRIRDPGWRQFGSGIWDGKKPDMEILIIFVSSQGYTEDTVRIFVNCVYWCRNVSYKEEIFKKGKLKKLEITFGPKMALASAQGHWRGQKSLKGKIFIVHPFNWAALWVSPPKNNYIPQHLQNGYINSYKNRKTGIKTGFAGLAKSLAYCVQKRSSLGFDARGSPRRIKQSGLDIRK